MEVQDDEYGPEKVPEALAEPVLTYESVHLPTAV